MGKHLQINKIPIYNSSHKPLERHFWQFLSTVYEDLYVHIRYFLQNLKNTSKSMNDRKYLDVCLLDWFESKAVSLYRWNYHEQRRVFLRGSCSWIEDGNDIIGGFAVISGYFYDTVNRNASLNFFSNYLMSVSKL